MKMACTNLVISKDNGRIAAVKCAKGRGIILPGGRWEEGETPFACASRELKEETGLIAEKQRLIFQSPSPSGEFYTYCMLTKVKPWLLGHEYHSIEGTFVLATWGELCRSKFGFYYELLYDVVNSTKRRVIEDYLSE